LCIAGERLWATGQPITPRRVRESCTSRYFALTVSVKLYWMPVDAITDLHQFVDRFSCAAVTRELFPDYPGPIPRFLPAPLTAGLATPGESWASVRDR
jgi:hypothetical protein